MIFQLQNVTFVKAIFQTSGSVSRQYW